MSRHIEVALCDSCKRGMVLDRLRNRARCFVCLRETEGFGPFWDFDPTGEFLQFDGEDIVQAIMRECVGATQKEVAGRMNITPQYLNDVITRKRGISPVIAAYYWLDRATIYIPRFTRPEAPNA